MENPALRIEPARPIGVACPACNGETTDQSCIVCAGCGWIQGFAPQSANARNNQTAADLLRLILNSWLTWHKSTSLQDDPDGEYLNGSAWSDADKIAQATQCILAKYDSVEGDDGWFSIDCDFTPKDGTRIWVGREDPVFGWIQGTAHYETGMFEGWLARGDGRKVADGLGLAFPTHWRYLPSPPSETPQLKTALHSESLLKDLLAVAERAADIIEHALPKFNWGASALDARAIEALNKTPNIIPLRYLIANVKASIHG